MKVQRYIKSDWERTDMASGPIWDNGDYRIIEKSDYDLGTNTWGEEYYILRDKSNQRTRDKRFNTLAEAMDFVDFRANLNSSRQIKSARRPIKSAAETSHQDYIMKQLNDAEKHLDKLEDLYDTAEYFAKEDDLIDVNHASRDMKEDTYTLKRKTLQTKSMMNSRRPIKSARYIATDPESGEVLGSADTYEEAVNEWGEDVTITDSEAAEGQEDMEGGLMSSRQIKSAVDGGWEVRSSDVPEALDLYVEYVGEENALESIARAMSSDTLKENIEWIAQQWGFGEDLEDYDDSWDMYEYAKEVMGESELFNNLTQAAGYDELAEDLAYIFRMEDFREWDKYDNEVEEDEEGYDGEISDEEMYADIDWRIDSNLNATLHSYCDIEDPTQFILDKYLAKGGEFYSKDQYSDAMIADKEIFEEVENYWKDVSSQYEEYYDNEDEPESFKEWLEKHYPENGSENIESSFNSKHLMSRFAALSNEGQEYVLSQMNCDNEEELEDKIYSYADLYANRNAQMLISNAEREVYEDVNTTPKKIVSSILDGSLTKEKAVQQIASNYDCNTGYARQILNSWISENKEDLIASGAIVNDYNKPFDRDGTLDTWYAEYVPESGPANTVGGELVRAFQSMDIAYYNDGDMIGCGYGKQTVNPSARFIMNNADLSVNKQINNWLSNKEKATPETYLTFLESARTELEDFLRNNEELFHTPNSSFIGSATEDGDMRITECYAEDGDGNDYFFRKVGDNEWECTGVDFAPENQEWNEGDTFTDDDEISNEVDPSEDWGSFEKDGITYEWNAIDDADEDNRHHEWEISMKVIYDQFCAEGDILSDDDLDPDNLDGLTLRDMNGNEIEEREFLASALGYVYSAYVVGKGKVGIELNLNGWKTINADGKPTGGTPAEFPNEDEAKNSTIYRNLVKRYGEDKVRTFRQN